MLHLPYQSSIPRLPTSTSSALVSVGPCSGQPLIWLLWNILVGDLSLKWYNIIPRQVIQCVLEIWSRSDRVWDSLHIVGDFLVDHNRDVGDLSVDNADLIAVVGVDYAHAVSIHSNDVLDCSISLCLVQTIAAGLVERAKILCVETSNVVFPSERVILEDLVGSIPGSTSNDAQLGVQSLGRKCIFAHIFPPHYRLMLVSSYPRLV